MKLFIDRLVLAVMAASLPAVILWSDASGASLLRSKAPLTCDDSMKAAFNPKPLSRGATTRVQLVKQFRKGDPLLLSGDARASTPVAPNDICLVKLLVGPGNSGPAEAPSTTPGIGIDVWLPSPENWNKRIEVLGNSGWAGGPQATLTGLGSSSQGSPWEVAGSDGSVSATTDTGHPQGKGDFLMNPDGTLNKLGWQQYSALGTHEMIVKTKALTMAFYGQPARYSYWRGSSTGGRQGLKHAQDYPTDFDGIIAQRAAVNFTRLLTAAMYPSIVTQQDLGGPLTAAQLTAVSRAAINSCDVVGGQHLGYILDPAACTYDPIKDSAVLCASSGGTNSTPACVTTAQARAINKIWYGPTTDGSAPSPAVDNGAGATLAGVQRWWGYPRGADLSLVAGPTPQSIAADMLALVLQDPALAMPTFRNANSNGKDLWKTISYARFSDAYDRGLKMQDVFAHINTDNPDLRAVRDHGTKIISVYGLSDNLIPYQGFVNYYNQVAVKTGGMEALQKFYRTYLVPGQGHMTVNGTANPDANPPAYSEKVLFQALRDWVEKGVAPGRIDIASLVTPQFPMAKSRPICVYPLQATYSGSGDINSAASYTCS